jgi:16S rRNA (cytidine1402-2'-O)-methyltransferase
VPLKPALYLVATPIGNMEDVTLRALDVLSSVDRVFAEDTRSLRRLCSRHDLKLKSRPVRCDEHTERGAAKRAISMIADGESVALATDAGSPGVSDPGYRLVRAVLDVGHDVVPVPGPTSVIAAVTASGLPCDRFAFEGFLPPKGGKRNARLRGLLREARTIVLFESPHRLARTLSDLAAALGERRAVLAREMTKLHETFHRGTLTELAERVAENPLRGEIVIVVEGAGK